MAASMGVDFCTEGIDLLGSAFGCSFLTHISIDSLQYSRYVPAIALQRLDRALQFAEQLKAALTTGVTH